VQNGQGFAVLRAAGHQPPINAITAACGVGAVVTGLTGSVPTCLTGPVNAIISGSGERHRHYTAGIFVGLLALAFGLFAPVSRISCSRRRAHSSRDRRPRDARVLQSAFTVSFGSRFTLGALVTFHVTVADVPVFGIGAAFAGDARFPALIVSLACWNAPTFATVKRTEPQTNADERRYSTRLIGGFIS
jgi:benzoate membrane transport protein